VALDFGLVKLADVLDLLDSRPPQVELVLTGRGAPAALIARADLVTEMLQIKHPFTEGVEARKGIEF
jgi:cob(I)alamin adenosyltransferase